jgi:hypothetical protein
VSTGVLEASLSTCALVLRIESHEQPAWRGAGSCMYEPADARTHLEQPCSVILRSHPWLVMLSVKLCSVDMRKVVIMVKIGRGCARTMRLR